MKTEEYVRKMALLTAVAGCPLRKPVTAVIY